MTLGRDELIYLSRVCEQTERFEDMLTYMKQVANDHPQELSVEERNLLSVAYKNSVGSRRTAWRVVSSLQTKEEAKTDWQTKLLNDYKAKIEQELDVICNEVIKILDEKLIGGSQQCSGDAKGVAQCQVFYLKMKGDYYRYISEYKSAPQTSDAENAEAQKTAQAKAEAGQKAAAHALEAYGRAMEIATKSLDTTDPIRLGLALNFSVFYYEVKNDPKMACELAKQAFDLAIGDIESIDECNYKDATTIMQLIRDNLTLWTSEMDDKDTDK